MADKKYTVLIVDDDKASTTSLEEAFEQKHEFDVVATANNYKKGIHKIMDKHPNLLFLDVEMPDGYGYDLLQEIRERVTWKMMVVFYSAYSHYMLQAIRQSAFDYLLKPFDENELNAILNRFKDKFQKSDINIPILPTDNKGGFFIVNTPTGGLKKIHYSEIGYFEYDQSKRIWQIIHLSKSRINLKTSTKSEDITKTSKNFFKINKHQIINMDYFSTIDDGQCLLTDPFNDDHLPISHAVVKEMQDKYGVI